MTPVPSPESRPSDPRSPDARDGAPPSKRRAIRPVFWIALAACVAHGPSLANDPVLDDLGQLAALLDPPRSAIEPYEGERELPRIVEHRHAPGTPVGIADCLATAAEPWWRPEHRVWRPGARVLMNLERLAGTAAGMADSLLVLRAATLGLHLAACLAVFAFARRIRLSDEAALAAALLLAVHPLRAEAIHQLVGQTELLAALGMMGGLALRIRSRDALDTLDDLDARHDLEPGAGASLARRRRLALAAVVAGDCAAFALALSGKEHAILYPLYAGLCEVARRRSPKLADSDSVSADAPIAPSPRRSVAPELASALAMGCVAAAYLAAKIAVTGGLAEPPEAVPFHENAIARLPFAERIAPSLGILGLACTKFLAPFGIAHDYSAISLPLASGWRWPLAWVGGAILLGALLFAARDLRRGGRGWTLAFGSLAAWGITSNLLFPIGVAAAPRLWYFPMIGPAIALGWGWDAWRRRVLESSRFLPSESPAEPPNESDDPAYRRRPALALFVALALLAAVSLRRAPEWRNVHRWMDAVHRMHPESYRANHFLAAQAYLRRDFAEGIERARDAVRASPRAHEAYVLLGFNASGFRETWPEAEAALHTALRLQPDSPDALAGLRRLQERRARGPAPARANSAP